MVTVAQKKKFQSFAKRWKGRGYEKGDTAQFWIELLGLLGYEVEGTSPFEYHLANGGFIDVWLHDAGVLVEQLDAAVEAAYGVSFGGDESRIVAHLFSLYAEMAKR